MKTGRRPSGPVMLRLVAALLCVLAGHAPAQGSGRGDREALSNNQPTEPIPSSSSTQGTSSALFVPVILTASGLNNSFYTSELTLTNRGDREARLEFTYAADAGGGSGTATEVLAPGQQKIQPDALKYLRGLGMPIPHSGNRIGTLRVEVSGSSEVGVSVRTTTSVPEGRAGLAYQGIAAADGFTEAVYLCGLRQNSQDRSNVAVQNMGAPGQGTVTLRTTVYSGEVENRSPHVLPDVTLPPGGFHQYNGILNLAGFDNGYVRVERVSGQAPFYAYGVINDQANSDGSFVFPVTASSLMGTTRQTLPVIVETGVFTSELTVTNFSDVAKTVTFRFRAEAVETADKTATVEWTFQPGQQMIVPDIVDMLRKLGAAGVGPAGQTFAGALFASVAEGDMSGIVIGARTGSEGGGGQYSVFYNAVPEGAAFTEVAWVDGLQQNEENRSNLALVNTGEVDGSASVFHLEIYDGETGLLAETVVTKPIPARRWHQINGILGSYAPETRQGYIRILKVSGGNPFLAYGVVNDGGAPGERSGDGAFLPAIEEKTHDPVTEPMTDREVLEAFYHATGGPNWNNRTNWLSALPLSEWYGVETDGSRRVTSLTLETNRLIGTIPPVLSQLTRLQELNLGDDNRLSGPIPPELGQLRQLQKLLLWNNQLSGPIPPELGGLAHLQILALEGNELTGAIPPELGGLTQLQELGLGPNQLSGPIPPELGGLARLQSLFLTNNQLTGAIPAELGGLTQLQGLSLWGNQLSGPILPELGQLTRLQWLRLEHNQLTGAIPRELGQLSRLHMLNLGGNQLTGAIPKHLQQLLKLTRLDLSDTQVCVPADAAFQAWLGTIARFLASGLVCDGKRRVLFLASSYEVKEGESVAVSVRLIDQTGDPLRSAAVVLTATPGGGAIAADYSGVPESITIMSPQNEASFFFTAVEDDHVDHGETVMLGFRHPLPSGINAGDPDMARVRIIDPGTEAMTDREVLEVLFYATDGPNWSNHTNWLSDLPLSEWFGVETDASDRVTSLSLQNNQLSGTIPPGLGSLTNLQELWLAFNQLSGAIPSELSQLGQLQELFVSNNQLSGTIPPGLGQLTQLQELDLVSNQLTGAIPPELGGLTQLHGLGLGGNQLAGTIPPELAGLTHLRTLDLRGNQLSGQILPELGQLTGLQWLDLGNNQLSGAIPPELGGLTQLHGLGLGHNQLTGAIPPELGGLTQLHTLRLWRNQLSGMVPPELARLKQLQRLDLSFNSDVSGMISPGFQQLPLSTLDLMATSVCISEDEEVQEWLATIEFTSSGLTCGHPPAEMSEIDIAVFYTPAARKISGGTAEMEAIIDLMIAGANPIYVADGVNQRLVLVAREEVEYTGSGSGHVDLGRLVNASDGYMDEVHSIRDQAGADLVHLISYVTDVKGVAQLAGAFGLTKFPGGFEVFTHELGHNMGVLHDRYNDGGDGLFPYSHGYVNQRAFVPGAPKSARWGTIMAYRTQCFDAGFNCGFPGRRRFSTPNETYLGDPIGVPGEERTTAADGPADAVRTLNIMRHSLAGFRPRASGNRSTMPATVSQARPMVTTGGTAPPLVPVGDLFRVIATNREGTASRQTGGVLARATLRRREVSVDIQRLTRVVDGKPTALRLNLFDDVVLTGIIEHRTPTYSGGYALSGRLAEVAWGTVTLVVNGSVVAGTVRLPGATYRIRPAGRGRHAIMQIDPSKLPQGCEIVSRKLGPER